MDELYTACRIGLGGVFLVAGIGKLRQPDVAMQLIRRVLSVSQRTSAVLVAALAMIEAGIGLWAIIGLFDVAALWSIIGGLTCFLVVLCWLRGMGQTTDCGCFGGGGGSWKGSVVRNIVLLATAVGLLVASSAGEAAIPIWEITWEAVVMLGLFVVVGGLGRVIVEAWTLVRERDGERYLPTMMKRR